MKYYSTVEDVIVYSGIEFDKLNLSNQDELKALIGKWLLQIKSLIDRNRGRDLLRDLSFGDKIDIINPYEWNLGTIKSDDLPLNGDNVICEIEGIGSINTAFGEFDLSKAKTFEIVLKPNIDLTSIKINMYKDEKKELLESSFILPSMSEDEWKIARAYLGMNDELVDIKAIEIFSDVNVELKIGQCYAKEIPEGIHNIAMRACANMIKLAYMNRESPVIKIEDLNATLVKDEILTAELRKELGLYLKKSNIEFTRVEGLLEDE